LIFYVYIFMASSVSPIDSRILQALDERGRAFIDLNQDRDWLREIASDPPLQLARMKKRGILESVAAGRYVALPPGQMSNAAELPLGVLLAAAFAGREDYYLGYLSALIDHSLTDEHSLDVHVAVFGTPPNIEDLAGRPLHMTSIASSRKQFGRERVRAIGRTFYFRSDFERTLLDTLDRPALCGSPETSVRAWSRAFGSRNFDRAKLVEYAEGWEGTVAARCAFWVRELGDIRLARRLLRSIGAPLSGPRLLDAARSFGDGTWKRDRETGLIVNIPAATLDGWLSYDR
jgi:predicted transcriptional regulator of viral defense system